MSRLKAGLALRLRKPDATALRTILKNLSMVKGVTLPEDVLNGFVSMTGVGVREIEGFLEWIMAESEFSGKGITPVMSKQTLNATLKGCG